MPHHSRIYSVQVNGFSHIQSCTSTPIINFRSSPWPQKDPSSPKTPLVPLPNPGNQWSAFYLNGFASSRYSIHGIPLSGVLVTAFLDLAQRSTLICAAGYIRTSLLFMDDTTVHCVDTGGTLLEGLFSFTALPVSLPSSLSLTLWPLEASASSCLGPCSKHPDVCCPDGSEHDFLFYQLTLPHHRREEGTGNQTRSQAWPGCYVSPVPWSLLQLTN